MEVCTLSGEGLKFKLMNAIMKLKSYMQYYGSLPSFHQLEGILSDIEHARRAQTQAALNDASISRRLVRDWPYRERFNLRPMDVELMRAGAAPAANDVAARDLDVAWGNYVRFLFTPHYIYRFSALPVQRFFVHRRKQKPARSRCAKARYGNRPRAEHYLVRSGACGSSR